MGLEYKVRRPSVRVLMPYISGFFFLYLHSLETFSGFIIILGFYYRGWSWRTDGRMNARYKASININQLHLSTSIWIAIWRVNDQYALLIIMITRRSWDKEPCHGELERA